MITVIDRYGRERRMPERYARILSRIGRVTYITRDMVAPEPVAVEPVVVVEPPAEVTEDAAPEKRRRARKETDPE